MTLRTIAGRLGIATIGLVVVVFGVLAAGTSCFATLGGTATGARKERVKSSPHRHGSSFENPHETSMGSGAPKQWLFGDEMRVPSCPLPLFDKASLQEIWKTPPTTGLRVTWLGHSTSVIEIDGIRVLTDPQFSEMASPVSFAGPVRFHPPVVSIAELPSIDAIVISHDHYDHLDMKSVQQLAVSTHATFFVGLGVGAHLEAWGIDPARIVEHDWWESTRVGDVDIVSTPAQHFSGRSLTDQNATLWTSWTLKSAAHAAFFSGDTGLTPQFEEIGRKYGPFDVALLEIGQYNIAWGSIHLGPAGAITAAELLEAKRVLPIHWGTFNIAYHAWNEPPETFYVEAPKRGLDIAVVKIGEPMEPQEPAPGGGRGEPWWRALPPIAKACPSATSLTVSTK